MSPRCRLTAVILAAATLAGASLAQEWSRFRGPNGSGVSGSKNLPTEFGPEKNLTWSVEIPFARSSPVLAGDRIFLTAIDADTFTTLALDRASGDELWRREIERDRQSEMHHDTDSATPSPVTDGSNVFAFFQETGLVAYNARGDELWRLALGPFRNFYGMSASPVLAEDTLFLVCDQNGGSFLLAVDKNTGKQRWRQERPGRSLSYTTPILYPDAQHPRELVVLGDRWLDAYDLSSGESRWVLNGLGVGPVSSPVLSGDMLFVNAPDQAPEPLPPFSELAKEHDADGDGVMTRQEVEGTWMTKHYGFVDWDGDGSLSAEDWQQLNQSMSTDDWGIHAIRLPGQNAKPEILWSSQQSVPYIPTGIVVDGALYLVKDGIVSSYDTQSGELLKRGRLAKGSPKVYASPVAADGKIFIGTLDGQMVVLQAGAQWEVLATNDLEDEIWATPAIVDGFIYVRTRGKLFSFSAAPKAEASVSP
jgi:outer membrane protein assembly factor BamB